ncbi:sulfur reduction protein DsrS [Thiohalobacter sp. IOR34]|uniref:sulfur reduction protein DsrS n=1 Tax=Thiohalobacter sp. IOR34 TaxID=3057176 RepID=UPI0025AF94DD|nr:sulfur reduction protein DsrS [Thiohalobacter sp. IOR34]WJW74328.1 sulfur reduction protein DsrS [Thiohalobacter sp. IOR34]
MDLTAEDALRLNVLLANELHAVRIDESSMTVYGLSPQGETVVRLNPNCRDELYLKRVRELFSSQVLGSPGGYPVYLKRWTRMGQARNSESLEKLLLLGEPEAVVAVVHSPGLDSELARRAWWAMPCADNARRLLQQAPIAAGPMGPVLAEYLIEFLPFEESHQAIIDSIRLVLQPGLIDAGARDRLWVRGRHKNTYYVGFLRAIPDELPLEAAPHPLWPAHGERLQALAAGGNAVAGLLGRVLDAPGQAFLETVRRALRKPNNQDVVVELLESIRQYFLAAAYSACPAAWPQEPEQLLEQAEQRLAGRLDDDPCGDALRELQETLPELAPQLQALCALAAVSERLVTPIFARTDAIGSLMRRKIAPVTEPLFEQLGRLQAAG